MWDRPGVLEPSVPSHSKATPRQFQLEAPRLLTPVLVRLLKVLPRIVRHKVFREWFMVEVPANYVAAPGPEDSSPSR